MNESLRTQVTAEIMAAMRSFETAERSRDAEALIGHFASVPTFHVYNDGRRVTYEAMVAGLRSTFPDLRSIEGDFEDIHVIVLASDAALATAHFRETVTDRRAKRHESEERPLGCGNDSMANGVSRTGKRTTTPTMVHEHALGHCPTRCCS
jgi:ketosteroid isomerase-like protein